MARYGVHEVFTPTTYAELTFVDRMAINTRLVDALDQPGMQIVVYGTSGCGKSTLLHNKLRQVYDNHIVTKCSGTSTYEELVVSAFDSMNRYFVAETGRKVKKGISASMSASYLTIKAKLGAELQDETEVKEQRIIPPQLTAERLAQFLGEAKCAWVLEDFHKVARSEKAKISQIMKTFVDMASEYRRAKIIAIGAVGSARQVIEYDSEMRNRVTEIAVPLMTDKEVKGIVGKGADLLNLSFRPKVVREITTYSCGLPSVVHQLGLNICHAIGLRETSAEPIEVGDPQLQKAVQRYLENTSDTLRSVFDLALQRGRERKYDNGRLILTALAHLPFGGSSHAAILHEIRREVPAYPSGNLTSHLRELQKPQRGEIIRLDPYSKKFDFADPFYKAFALCQFGHKDEPEPEVGLTWAKPAKPQLDELFKMVLSILNEQRREGGKQSPSGGE